jgi:nucleotide-binding universal stress UspA family protein
MSQHKVLIPIDGSDFSRQIFAHVMKFLPPQENVLYLLRVGDPPEGHVGHPARVSVPESSVSLFDSAGDVVGTIHPIYASQERDSAEAEFRRVMQHDLHQLEAAGYTVASFVRFGEPGDAIVAFAEANDVDLVAMTTHWRRGLNRLIFGSVAQHVAQRLSMPVLMMRADEAD